MNSTADWRIRRRYGFGAARLTLPANRRPTQPAPFGVASVGAALREVVRDQLEQGVGAVAKRGLVAGATLAAAIAIALLTISSLTERVLRVSHIDLVMLPPRTDAPASSSEKLARIPAPPKLPVRAQEPEADPPPPPPPFAASPEAVTLEARFEIPSAPSLSHLATRGQIENEGIWRPIQLAAERGARPALAFEALPGLPPARVELSRAPAPIDRLRLPDVGSPPPPVLPEEAFLDPGAAAGPLRVPASEKLALRRGIRGVSLASMASCRSDAREDLLKEKLLTSVQMQVECNSSAGTYHFLETKNLNAFLMWVDRNPEREVRNRCGELQFALDCLAQASKE